MNTRISTLIEKLKLAQIAQCAIVAMLVAIPGASQAFHFPWDQGHDTTDWDDPNDPGPCEGSQCDPCNSTGSPVYLPTGHLIRSEKDLSLPGRPGLSLTRTYNSHDPRDGIFGRGWSTNCDDALLQFIGSEFDQQNEPTQLRGYVLRAATGKRYTYRSDANGVVQAPSGRFERVQATSNGAVQLISSDSSSRTFSRAGRLLSAQSPSGQSIAYSYSTDGRLQRLTDAEGRFIAFGYNSRGRVESVSDSAGRTWRYGYDAAGNLISVVSPNGGIRRYEYRQFSPVGDGHSYTQLTSVIDETGYALTSVTYNGERVASYTVGQNRINYSYNPTARSVTETDSVGSQWTYNYDEAGRITVERDPLGGIRRSEYNTNGRLVRLTDALQQQWNWTYDSQDRLIAAVNPAGERRTWEYQGDSPNPVHTTSPSGRVTAVAYDASGNITQITDPAGAQTAFTWSASGNLQNIRNAAGAQYAVETDSTGLPTSITDAAGRTVSFAYDPAGQVASVQSSAGPLLRTEYNAMGWPAASVEASGARTTYGRDLSGRPLQAVDPRGLATTYEYDSFGRIAARLTSDGRRFRYTYRSDNLLSQRTRPDGIVESYTYDAAKRLIGTTAGSDSVVYTYNARHQLTSAANSAGTISLAYDAVGRLISEGFGGQSVAYAYNSDGEQISISSAAGLVQLTRDSGGRVAAIDTPEGRYGLSYDALSRRTSLAYPNGTAVQYTYNNLDQLTGLRFTGAFNETLGYTYGNDSLLRQRSSSQATWNYGYDADGQMSTAVSGAQSFTYQYDGSGNRVGSGRVYDNANRLMADADFTYTYDAGGNLVEKRATADGARTLYFWNERGLLRAVERYASAAATVPDQRLEFTYDALGRRTGRVAGGVSERYVYSGQDRLATLDATGRITERVTHGPNVDEPLSLHGDQGARFLHADHLGTIIGASSASSVLERYEYGPFGEALGSAAAIQNAYRYTAREAEAPDLYYYRARYYDPTAGRFISEDPLGIASGETNLYRYAANNPIHAADPTGEAIWFIVPIIWGAVEIGLAIYDAYDTGSTLLDPCASGGEKWLAGGLFLLGAVLPGGGYSAADDIVVIGRQWDTAVAKDWPGHNVLDVSDWTIGKNDAWVKDAIDRNSPVYIASPPTPANMFDDVAGRETVFGREYQQFLDAGYTHQGDYLIPPP